MYRDSDKRVLFVSYLFPPAGGVGVQRVTKFVKYLPEFGWTPSVLTVANPSVPLHDESLCRDVPAETIVCSAKTWEPAYRLKNCVAGGREAGRTGRSWSPAGVLRSGARRLATAVLQPDPQILWWPQAVRAGLNLLRKIPHQVIVASGPPFSTLLVGASLSRRTRLPLILDYRDEWEISNRYWENKGHGRLSSRLQSALQRSAIRAADLLLATTPSSAAALSKLAEQAGGPARSTWIYNGYDPDDFQTGSLPRELELDPQERATRFRLTFVGTLWNLNPVEPVVRAVRRLCQTEPQLAARLELVFIGRRTPEQDAELDQLAGLPVRITRLPFVPHASAIAAMQDADALLVLNAELPHTERIINAKTFEYLASRRPLLVIAPRGDLWDAIESFPEITMRRPSDVAGIVEGLTVLMQRHLRSGRIPSHTADTSMYERRHLTGELAVLLDELAADRPPEAPRPFLRRPFSATAR